MSFANLKLTPTLQLARRFVIWSAAVIVLIGVALSAAVVHAEQTAATAEASRPQDPVDAPAEVRPTEWIQQVDRFFGDYLVTPLNRLLFFSFGTERWIGERKFTADVRFAAELDARRLGELSRQFEREDLPLTGPVRVTVSKPGRKWLVSLPEQGKTYIIKHRDGRLVISEGKPIPFIVVWLVAGAIYFTLRMQLINLRGFWHAICLTKGDYDDPEETGEVSHFQALSAALSATVGLGNIAGVAIAVGTGGPGATFWMIVVGLLGMSSKFTECTLGQMYRKVAPDGTVSGGAMHYLRDGLAELGLRRLGSVLAVLFALMCIGASFGGGNAFQVGQSLTAIQQEIPLLRDDQYPWLYGLVMAVLVGLVIIGGIRSIGAVASRIVPFMCGAYVLASIYIIGCHADRILPAFGLIFQSAFTMKAGLGGLLGVMVIGVRRAVFSNEAGIGSAAIAHSAAKTEEPVSEGIVALLEPFIDTVVVCTMTALVIIITGVYEAPEYAGLVAGNKGAALTAAAFSEGGHDWFRWILYAAVVLFAYSTLISWSYYGERCFTALFGQRMSMVYKIVFLVFVFLGSIVTKGKVLEFSDLLILGMAFPNILGLVLLSGKVKRALDEYWSKYRSGQLVRPRDRNREQQA